MRKRHAVLGSLILAFFAGCDSSSDTGGSQFSDSPGAITAPSGTVGLVVGDTFDVLWTNAIEDPEIAFNFNDTNGLFDYNDAEWHLFPDSQVLTTTSTSARVYTSLQLSSRSRDYRIRVTNLASGASSVSNKLNLDHVAILSPVAGETFAVGQTVPVKFRRNRFMDRAYLVFAVGLDNSYGFSFNQLNEDFNFQDRGLGSITTNLDTSWVIGTEMYQGAAEYPSDSCYFYAYSYYLGTQFQGDPSAPGKNSDRNVIPFRITQ